MEICLSSLFHIAFELCISLDRSDNLRQAYLLLQQFQLAEMLAQLANFGILEMEVVSGSLPKGLEHLEKGHLYSLGVLL